MAWHKNTKYILVKPASHKRNYSLSHNTKNPVLINILSIYPCKMYFLKANIVPIQIYLCSWSFSLKPKK